MFCSSQLEYYMSKSLQTWNITAKYEYLDTNIIEVGVANLFYTWKTLFLNTDQSNLGNLS